MAKKMTADERENTKFNVIEVVTEFNVPQSAKVVLSNVRYHDLLQKLAKYLLPHFNSYYSYKFSEKELTNKFESKVTEHNFVSSDIFKWDIEKWCPKKTEKEQNLEGFAKFFG